MTHAMHESVVALINEVRQVIDQFLRSRIDVEEFSAKLKALDVKDILVTYKEDFKKNAELVYYLDALMLLSSLQDELDFQVAEYGANVALEDMRYLEELLDKFPET
ncbi:MAG: hypothetical protein H8E19_17115 [Deltaproteobacteria bacterium]|uniref:Uncharacterized protein n=1 Tax=Candidatus Desulfacyla euxinica TaxID=2841693 RepID=A0A8J6N3X7_9DELT|nr:hypothetical protein [Candidatus Desulfacyla euxinica]